MNSYDIDGVINLGEYVGIKPREDDIIVTGRSLYEESEYTLEWLKSVGIFNKTFLNPVFFKDKTRENSGEHKAATLNYLLDCGYDIGVHFEDDEVQAEIISTKCPRVRVVLLQHDLVDKENKWHGPTND